MLGTLGLLQDGVLVQLYLSIFYLSCCICYPEYTLILVNFFIDVEEGDRGLEVLLTNA